MSFTIITPFPAIMTGTDVTSAIKQFAKQYYIKHRKITTVNAANRKLSTVNITFKDNQNNYYSGSLEYFIENSITKVKIIVNTEEYTGINPNSTNSFINYPQIPIVRLPINALPFVGPQIIPLPIISPPIVGIANNGLPVILPSRPILPIYPYGYPSVIKY